MNYFTLSRYLKTKFGCKVSKVAVDAGFTCPNRDGTKGEGGCIYCDNSSFVFTTGDDIKEQVRNGIDRLLKKGIERFIIYLQSYSNTYCSDETFFRVLDDVLIDERIVGIHIGTRPDVINDNKLKRLSELTNRYDIFMEYGLQSAHNETLKFINRGHTYEDFLEAVDKTVKYGLKITVHLIFGLPYEDNNMMMETVKRVSKLPIHSVKFHHLHIVKGTKLSEIFLNNPFHILTEDEYIKIVADALTYFKNDIIVARLVGDAPRDMVIEPKWPLSKNLFLSKLNDYMIKNNLYQGKNFN